MVYQIADTSSWGSTETGKTYSSKARAEAAEKASKRMKQLWEERKIPFVDPSAPYKIDWEDIPASEKVDTTDTSRWHGKDHRKHAAWWYENKNWESWPTENYVNSYNADIDATEILDAVLEKSSRFKDFEMHYFELAKEWKLIKKKVEEKKEETPTGDFEVKGTEHGIKAGV